MPIEFKEVKEGEQLHFSLHGFHMFLQYGVVPIYLVQVLPRYSISTQVGTYIHYIRKYVCK